jgi:von Willebrand factor type A domain.
MFDQPASRRLRPAWFLFFSLFLLPFSVCLAQDVRADLPANNLLRVENRRGSVNVEVWDEQHVSITALFDGETPKSSPVIIRRTEQLLNVLIASAATSTASSIRVNLLLRIPARSRVEIFTNNGEVLVRGLPAALSVQTGSGNIRASLPLKSDADISAEAVKVDSEFALKTAASKSGKVSRARLGKGNVPVRLRSLSGQIALASLSTTNQTSSVETARVDVAPQETRQPPETRTPEARKPPTLIGGANNNSPAGTPATPETGEPIEVDEGDVVRVDTEVVTLNVSVIDRGTNRGLVGLAQSDFKIYEDGVEQRLTHFESSTAPFNLVLLIDLSGSTRDKVKLIRAAAQRFVDAARPDDSIAVITFASAPVVVSRLTNDRTALRQRISAIETQAGDTKLYDSLGFAMTEALKDAGSSRRTAIVVMSDGLDGTLPSVHGDGSAVSYAEILGQIREFDGVLYTLWVNTEYESLSEKDTQPEDFDAGHDRMEEMAEAGGGLFYEVDKLEDLAGSYERVVADIGTVYSLSYHPTNNVRDGRWRAILIKVAQPNAVARSRRGYYAK